MRTKGFRCNCNYDKVHRTWVPRLCMRCNKLLWFWSGKIIFIECGPNTINAYHPGCFYTIWDINDPLWKQERAWLKEKNNVKN